jgi:hypothetical protein
LCILLLTDVLGTPGRIESVRNFYLLQHNNITITITITISVTITIAITIITGFEPLPLNNRQITGAAGS